MRVFDYLVEQPFLFNLSQIPFTRQKFARILKHNDLSKMRHDLALIFVITFLSGFLLLFLGIIGEYVGRIYEEVKVRSIYIIRRKFGANSTQQPR